MTSRTNYQFQPEPEMIDPTKITNFTRTRHELEEFLLFCVIVAGKSADQQAKKLHEFLGNNPAPFYFVRELAKNGGLIPHLKHVRMGKYRDISKGFTDLVNSAIDLRTISWQSLTMFHGIGIKTAKLFVLHSRPGGMHAVLDTHVLRWMSGQLGLLPLPRSIKIPKASPGSIGVYEFWETVFFGLWAQHENQNTIPHEIADQSRYWAESDLRLWQLMRAA